MSPRPQTGILQRDRFIILLIGLFALLLGRGHRESICPWIA